MTKGDQANRGSSGQAKTANPDATAKRAYELFLQRGSVPGHEIEDWLQAEIELTTRAGDDAKRLDHNQETVLPARTAATSSAPETGSAAVPERSGGSRRNTRQPNSH